MTAYLTLAGFLLMVVAGQACFRKATLDGIFQSFINK